jgi:AraC-like DNA-binding protein
MPRRPLPCEGAAGNYHTIFATFARARAGRRGASVRTLQDNFRQFTGLSPSGWWRGYRLDRVDAALRVAGPDRDGGEGGVTQIATAYGFYHLGRFAERYRARFGETPSETLRRARIGRD